MTRINDEVFVMLTVPFEFAEALREALEWALEKTEGQDDQMEGRDESLRAWLRWGNERLAGAMRATAMHEVETPEDLAQRARYRRIKA